MKLIVSSDYVFRYATEYMNTFKGYIPTTVSQLHQYDMNQCEELIAVQNGNWLPDSVFQTSTKVSIVNIEQLCDKKVEDRVHEELLRVEQRCGYKPIVYEYSITNQRILEEKGWATIHHPYSTQEGEKARLQLLSNQEKRYDIGFVGGLNERRKKILDGLMESGKTVHIITEDYGEKRDIELAKCRYIINIHWESQFIIFESIRCNRWIESGYIVLSEDSIDTIDHPNLIQLPYDDMITRINDIFSQQDQLNHITDYIETCFQPRSSQEFIKTNQYHKCDYDQLRQDGFMIINQEVPIASIERGTDYLVVNHKTILRKNKPYQIEWLTDNGIQFDSSREPIYRRCIPPPIETIDHVFIISKIIASTNPRKDKDYIEYGVRSGTSIEAIAPLVNTAYGIDINDYKPQQQNIIFHKMLTDEFSERHLMNMSYDYAFIDADHSSKQVVIDFENIYRHMNKGGYIFLHDTYPCEELYLRPDYCNDCYMSPLLIRNKYPDIQMLTLPIQPGLTIIHKV